MPKNASSRPTPIAQPNAEASKKLTITPRPHAGLKETQAELGALLSDMLQHGAHDSDIDLVIQGALAHQHRQFGVATEKDINEYARTERIQRTREHLAKEWTRLRLPSDDEINVVPKSSSVIDVFRSRQKERLIGYISTLACRSRLTPEEVWIMLEILMTAESCGNLFEAIEEVMNQGEYIPVPSRHKEAVLAFVKMLEEAREGKEAA